MGRFLIVILILAVAGYLVYNYVSRPLGEEEQAVRDLERRFDTAARSFAGSGRMSGMTGLDMSSGAETAVNAIKRIRDELKRLRPELSEDKAVVRAGTLQEKIDEFYRANDLN